MAVLNAPLTMIVLLLKGNSVNEGLATVEMSFCVELLFKGTVNKTAAGLKGTRL